MEEGGRGEQLISFMGGKRYSCRKSKCWVNCNSSQDYGKARDPEWKAKWLKVRGNATTP